MALYVKQNQTRSQLQEKLATELQEKAKKKALEADRPDGVTDSAYIKGTKAAGNSVWLWVVFLLAFAGLFIAIILV